MYKGPGIGGKVVTVNIKALVMTGVLWAREMDKSVVLKNIEIKLHVLILSLKWYKGLSMYFLKFSFICNQVWEKDGRDCK